MTWKDLQSIMLSPKSTDRAVYIECYHLHIIKGGKNIKLGERIISASVTLDFIFHKYKYIELKNENEHV